MNKKTKPKGRQLWAVTTIDPEGNEVVVTITSENGPPSALAVTEESDLDDLIYLAKQASEKFPVKLYKFSRREEIKLPRRRK